MTIYGSYAVSVPNLLFHKSRYKSLLSVRRGKTAEYDYLWIWTIIYFALGFFNILFAWLGMIDFLLPLGFALLGQHHAVKAKAELRGPIRDHAGRIGPPPRDTERPEKFEEPCGLTGIRTYKRRAAPSEAARFFAGHLLPPNTANPRKHKTRLLLFEAGSYDTFL